MKEIKASVHNYRIAGVVRTISESNEFNADVKGCRNLCFIPVNGLYRASDANEQHYSFEMRRTVV